MNKLISFTNNLNMENLLNEKRNKIFLIEILGSVLGAFVMAFAVSFFLLPNKLSSGGFSGIATILYYRLKIPMGVTIASLNIPLFLLAGYKIGKDFFAKSLIGTLSLSMFIDLLDRFNPLTSDKMLAAIYGGILTGIGTAIILKSHSSTGGSDLLTNIIKKYNSKVELGRVITLIDAGIVFLNVLFLKKVEIGLYSAIAIYLMGLMIDVVFEGIFFSKLIFVISDKSEIIAKEIQDKINRGITGIEGIGMYENKSKLVLMCAVGRRDIANIKKIIMNIDKDAFVVVTNSREVLGAGFK